MNIQDIFYHGIRSQVKRALTAMTDEQIDKGLSAFTDGASNWASCFWARVFQGKCNFTMMHEYTTKKGVTHRGAYAIEWYIADQLGLDSNMPVRIVYNIFDTRGKGLMTHNELRKFINDVRFENNDSVDEILKSLDLSSVNTKEPSYAEVCSYVPSGV